MVRGTWSEETGKPVPGRLDAAWLLDRGCLHDARVTGVRLDGTALHIDLDDEWANDRGAGRPYEPKCPVTLIFTKAMIVAGDASAAVGGWISEVVPEPEGVVRMVFCDRETLVIRAGYIACEPAA